MTPINLPPIVLAWFLISSCMVSLGRADLIAYEGFNYSDGDLRGENGGEGDWTAPWSAGSGFGSGDSWQVAQPSLSYTDSGGRTLVTGGGAVTADASDSNLEFREARTWDSTGHKDHGDVLWFSYLFNRSSDADSDLRVFILGDGGLFNGVGTFIDSNNIHIAVRFNIGGTVHSGGAIPFSHDVDHFVVGRITSSDDDEDEIRYWLDPELDQIPLDTAPNSGAVTAAANVPGWNNFYMRQSQFPGVDMIDEIRIGTDFFSVVAIPEPSSLAFVGLAALVALMGRVSRRKESRQPNERAR